MSAILARWIKTIKKKKRTPCLVQRIVCIVANSEKDFKAIQLFFLKSRVCFFKMDLLLRVCQGGPMKKISCWLVGFFTLLCFVCYGQTYENKGKPLSLSDRLDKLFVFGDWARDDRPGGAVTVIQAGQVVYQKGFGLACLEYPVANSPKTVFDVAQLAQPVTAMAILMLENQGQLSLADDIRKYVPEVPDFGKTITLRHLLNQTSGLYDWLPLMRLSGLKNDDSVAAADILRKVKSQKRLLFTPGSEFLAANTNYNLLAMAVRKVTGKSFRDWTWENIFRPLKMSRTQVHDTLREMVENRAFPYNYSNFAGYLSGGDNLSAAGSHSLFTSVEDLSKWLLNLETGQVGGREVVAQLLQPAKLDNGKILAFGNGFQFGAYKGLKQLSCSGNWGAYRAGLHYFPEQRFAAVLVTNWDYNVHDPEMFLAGIADIVLEANLPAVKKAAPATAPKPPKEVKVKAAVLDWYVGDYRFGPNMIYSISREGENLFVKLGNQKMQLRPIGETRFLLGIADIQLAFQKGKDGKSLRLAFSGTGVGDMSGERIVLFKPTLEQLNEYAGTYYNEELDTGYAVTLQNGRLALSHPRLNDITLSPDEKDHFVGSSPYFRMLIFKRDEQNKIFAFFVDGEQEKNFIFKKK